MKNKLEYDRNEELIFTDCLLYSVRVVLYQCRPVRWLYALIQKVIPVHMAEERMFLWRSHLNMMLDYIT